MDSVSFFVLFLLNSAWKFVKLLEKDELVTKFQQENEYNTEKSMNTLQSLVLLTSMNWRSYIGVLSVVLLLFYHSISALFWNEMCVIYHGKGDPEIRTKSSESDKERMFEIYLVSYRIWGMRRDIGEMRVNECRYKNELAIHQFSSIYTKDCSFSLLRNHRFRWIFQLKSTMFRVLKLMQSAY